MILLCSSGSLCSQGNELQFINQCSQRQQFVSKNQLLTPRKAQQAADRARKDILHGRLEAAQKELIRALDVAPHFAVAIATLGAVDLQTGNIEAADKAFRHAVEEDPTLGAAYLGAAVVLIAQGKFKEALTSLDRATSLLPSSWYVHLEAGLAHLGLGDTGSALKEAGLAERFAGPDKERRSGASYLRALVYAEAKDLVRAREYLGETVARDPDGFYSALAKTRAQQLQVAVTNRN